MEIAYSNFRKMHEPLKQDFLNCYNEVFDSQWFIGGNTLHRFEKEFADFCGAEYCVGMGNGLDALQLMLRACNIGKGDEVIIPSNTFIATALAVSYVGAVPVMVEPTLHDLEINPDLIEAAITPNTKGIIAVHLYGRMCNMTRIKEIADKHNLYLFEDCAQAHGAKHAGKMAGTFGDVGAYSFYPGKNLGAFGDAGAVITNNEELAEKMRAIGNYGSYRKYQHDLMGVNSRLDDLQAGFLSVKLKHLDEWTVERVRIAKLFYSGIHNSKIRLPEYTEENVYHIFPIFCNERDQLQAFMSEKGIQCLIHYPIAIHLQKAYSGMKKHVGDYPIAEEICATELSIPLYPGLSEEEIQYIIDCLNAF